MFRCGFLILMVLLTACGSKKASSARDQELAEEQVFANSFPEAKLPYGLSDSALLGNKDTAQIRSEAFLNFIPDTLVRQLFGNQERVRYTPLAKFAGNKKESYYLVKGSRNNRKAALLVVADEQDSLTAVLPFLVPDADNSTRQNSSLEQNFSVVRTTLRLLKDEAFQEGKEVYAYSAQAKTFDLVMTDPLDDDKLELLNPIDTLGKTFKYAGDYGKEKRNIVSIRDGRKQGLITVFIHLEKKEGACTGEIKGDAEIVDEKTAIYRTAGDPCVLKLKFAKASVILEEQEGCGSRRGLECSFNGTFNLKKETKSKAGKRK